MKARAARTAFMVASVPEFAKRTTSMLGIRLVRSSASLTSCSLGPGKDMPRVACSVTASTTDGGA